MTLAWDRRKHKAGRFHVKYERLDDSDASGETPAALAQANAQRAAHDPRTAVYIGDYSSAATQQSIPILSAAKVPQISPSASRVGLTTPDNLIGDTDEPIPRYYRDLRSSSFVRLAPTAAVVAKSLLTRMATDGCGKAAMINDGGPFGQDFANNMLTWRDSYASGMRFDLSQSVGPKGKYDYLLARAKKYKPDCFVYAGSRNANTPDIFTGFRTALGPKARLYGSNGVADTRFYKAVKPFAEQVTVMLPWHARNKASQDFKNRFHHEYTRYPDPYAYNAYEAMLLALDAIKISATGKREDILTKLRKESPTNSVLGPYVLTAEGDIAPATAGISTISDGQNADPQRAPCRGC